MLIELGSRCINAERIVAIVDHPQKPNSRLLVMAGANLEISPSEASYIMSILETDTGYTDTQPIPELLSLHSRIAIHLKNCPNGATVEELQAAFPAVDQKILDVTLNELRVSGTICASRLVNGYHHSAISRENIEW